MLIVTPTGHTAGGSEQWLLGILNEGSLARAGWTVDAIVLDQGPMVAALRDAGATTIALPFPASPVGIAAHAPSLRRAIRARRPDVVIGNGVKSQLAVTLALLGSRIPSVWVKHDHSHDAALARVLGRSATLVVSTALDVGLPTGRADLIVIEPPRPPQPLSRDAARQVLREHGWAPVRRLSLGMITRLVPYKGVDLAIAAMADADLDDWELVVIGGDDPATPGESTRLRTLADGLGVSERVRLVGEIPAGGRLLSAFDTVGVLTRPGAEGGPSKEGYGIVASEAMLAGTPVVVAQPGPISQRLSTPGGPAGITLDAPDSTHLVRALAELRDDHTRALMAQRGRLAASGLPTQTDVARQFVEVVTMAADLP